MAEASNTYDNTQAPSEELPEYDPSLFEDDFSSTGDTGGLRVNFTKEEAESEARDFELLPNGTYVGVITECELRHSKSKKNLGKPMYNLTITISQGKYAKRKVWALVMLWNGALYSLSQLLKALGYPLDGTVPEADWFVGKQIGFTLRREAERKKLDDDGNDTGEKWPAKNSVGGFKRVSDVLQTQVGGASQSQADSLMP
jgi:hypothetical protein